MFLNNKLKGFIAVALISSIIYVFLIFQNRLPIAHDTSQYLQLQYVYFNEIVQNHSLPLWFPFTLQGFAGNYLFTPQITLLSSVFYFLGLFVKGVNYLYLFYFALWFEELFFLLGVIFLSSLYYKDKRAILFVSITLVGTTIWYPQIWWNFHLFYFVPITLYCIHKCFMTGLFRYFIFSIVFFTLAVYGNFIYCGIFISFVILIYILLISLIHFNDIKVFLKKNTKLKNIAVLLILISVIFFSCYYIKYGGKEIVYLQSTRDSSGHISLDTFLYHGGSIGWAKYREIFKRYGDSIDINLYAGFFLLPFVLISLLYGRKKLSFAVGGVALIVFLFGFGTFISLLFYYLYPFGKYFRHIGLTSTVFKLFIVFYAGFGFEIFLERMHTDKKPIFLVLISLVAVGCLFIIKPYLRPAEYLWFISDTERIISLVVPYAILCGSVFLLWLMYKTRVRKRFLVNLLLLLIALDFFSYKYSFIITRMPRVSDEVIGLFKPYKYSFSIERLRDTRKHLRDNARMRLFYTVYVKQSAYSKYTTYDIMESFFFTDSAISRYRTDFILKSIKEYFDTVKAFPNYTNKVYGKYSGIGYSKLAIFSKLNLVENESEMGKIFNMKNFTGDMLFTTNKDVSGIRNTLPSTLIRQQDAIDFENRNEGVKAKIWIKKFSFNMLSLRVSVDGPPDKYCLLYYSDAYHPHWNAYVNDRKVSIIKSNIGYKSVMIPYGTSEVIFKFGNAFYFISFFCSILLNLVLLSLIIYIFITELCQKTNGEKCQMKLPISRLEKTG